MTKHKIGIIGFGKIARDQHVPAIAASPDFELAGVSNVGSGKAPDSVPGFATYTEMLKALPDMAAVAICTPPGPRRSIAADCLTSGRHVLLEKPPAATVTEVRDIAERAQKAGRVAYASYHAQHNQAVKAAAGALAGKRPTPIPANARKSAPITILREPATKSIESKTIATWSAVSPSCPAGSDARIRLASLTSPSELHCPAPGHQQRS